MAFWPEEKAFLKQSGLRLKFLNSEYLILIEQFDEAIKGFEKLAETNDIRQKALAYVGMLIAVDLTGRDGSKEKAEKLCNWILQQKRLLKEPIYARALLFGGQLKTSRNGMEKKAIPFFKRYIQQFPKGRDIRVVKYDLAICYLKTGEMAKAEVLYKDLSAKTDIYTKTLFKRINKYKNMGERR